MLLMWVQLTTRVGIECIHSNVCFIDVSFKAIEEDTSSFVKELLSNKELSATIPPYPGGNDSPFSYVPISEYLRYLREKAGIQKR